MQKDLQGIHRLQDIYGHALLSKEHINRRDVAVVAEDDGMVVGFMYAGLMAQGTVAHIDHVMVDPDYRGKGVVQRMYRKAIWVGYKKGVKEAIGYICSDDFATASGFNALKVAAGADSRPYTHVFLNVENSVKELKLNG